jgi:hypothetical protein
VSPGSMWLVLCEEGDRSAQWVYEGLRARQAPAELVTAEMLAHASRWVHMVGPGRVGAELLLPDGRLLEFNTVGATLNRLTGLELTRAFSVSPDREYALQEVFALYLSVLQCPRGPILNRPSPQGLSGRIRSVPEWLMLAATSGLATLPFCVSSHVDTSGQDATKTAHPDSHCQPETMPDLAGASLQQIIVAAGEVFGADNISRATADAARRLTKLAGVELLGLQLTMTDRGEAWFHAADLYPDLSIGRDPLLDHLEALLSTRVPS